MIISLHVAEIAPGKTRAAIEMCKAAQSYDNKQPEVMESVIMKPLQGKANKIMIWAKYASLGVWEEHRKKQAADPEYLPVLKDFNEVLIPETHEIYQYEIIE